MAKSYYLETSVIRSRLVGHTQVFTNLAQKLKNKTRLTSKFIQMEFDRGFICHLIAFYFVLKDEKKISDALKWWTEDYSIRTIKNINYSYAEVFSGIENNDIERAVFKLREHIRRICDHFQFLIHRFEKNEIECYFQNISLNFDSFDTIEDLEAGMIEFYEVFKKNHIADCQIVQFFRKSKGVLKRLSEHNSKEKGFNRQKEKIEKIEQKTLSLSCSTCKKIGDTVIALECPEYAVLLTHDKAFEDLCKVFSLECEIIPSLRAEKPTKEVLKKLKKLR